MFGFRSVPPWSVQTPRLGPADGPLHLSAAERQLLASVITRDFLSRARAEGRSLEPMDERAETVRHEIAFFEHLLDWLRAPTQSSPTEPA